MPSPKAEWHEQRHSQGQALRVLRSLDSIALLMPHGTQADGEGMAFLTSGSRMGDKAHEIRSSRQPKSGQFICFKSGHFYLLPTIKSA